MENKNKSPLEIAQEIWEQVERVNGGHDFEQVELLIDKISSAIVRAYLDGVTTGMKAMTRQSEGME